MPADLYRYTQQSTPWPNGSTLRPIGDALTEIATLDGWAYVACDGDLPEQPQDLVLEPVEQTPAQILALTAVSPRHAFLLSTLARLRWEHEAAGITVDGLPVATDRESRPMLIAAESAASRGLRPDGASWKFADGISRPVSNAAMQQIALAVLAYVQSCYDREAMLAATIRATLIPDEAELHTGWPPRTHNPD